MAVNNRTSKPSPAAPPKGASRPELIRDTTPVDVILATVGDKKISVIKTIRDLTGLGLKEAKDLAESAPKPVKEGVSLSAAEILKEMFEKIGATVQIVETGRPVGTKPSTVSQPTAEETEPSQNSEAIKTSWASPYRHAVTLQPTEQVQLLCSLTRLIDILRPGKARTAIEEFYQDFRTKIQWHQAEAEVNPQEAANPAGTETVRVTTDQVKKTRTLTFKLEAIGVLAERAAAASGSGKDGMALQSLSTLLQELMGEVGVLTEAMADAARRQGLEICHDAPFD